MTYIFILLHNYNIYFISITFNWLIFYLQFSFFLFFNYWWWFKEKIKKEKPLYQNKEWLIEQLITYKSAPKIAEAFGYNAYTVNGSCFDGYAFCLSRAELLPAVDSTPIKARLLSYEAASPADSLSIIRAFLLHKNNRPLMTRIVSIRVG